jgi:GNAT superfamily N-acetyltransferase
VFIASETPMTIEPEDAEYIARALCNPGSEMQRELIDAKTDTPMVVAYDPEPIGWVATHLWRGLQTLEGYVDPDWRRKGLARIGALTLITTGYLDRRQAIAVFSDECVTLARSIGFKDVRQFRRNRYGDWEPSPL